MPNKGLLQVPLQYETDHRTKFQTINKLSLSKKDQKKSANHIEFFGFDTCRNPGGISNSKFCLNPNQTKCCSRGSRVKYFVLQGPQAEIQ